MHFAKNGPFKIYLVIPHNGSLEVTFKITVLFHRVPGLRKGEIETPLKTSRDGVNVKIVKRKNGFSQKRPFLRKPPIKKYELSQGANIQYDYS